MKIKLFLVAFLCLFATNAHADIFDDFLLLTSGSILPAGNTFYADYSDGLLDANKSSGSPTATYAATRGASNPATYIDSSGAIQTTTISNVGRFTYGYYDSSGYTAFTKAGLMIEGARENLTTRSSELDNATWSSGISANVTANSWTAPDGTVTGDTIAVAGDNDGQVRQIFAATLSAGATYTVSFFAKSSAS